MNISFCHRPLGEIVVDVAAWNPVRDGQDRLIRYIDLSSVNQDTKVIEPNEPIVAREAPSRARQLVQTGDVLVSTVRPNLNGVARVPETLDGSTASTGFCVLRPKDSELDGGYLFYWVKAPMFIADMVRKATGASYPAVSDRIVMESLIPLPPLVEQRRIAAILDQAQALRAKRRYALAQLDTLTRSLFLDLFGDPVTNAKRWSTAFLSDLLAIPLRNGLSPSNSGGVKAKVLTLSAITGDAFRADAWKEAPFQSVPPSDQRVDAADLLICRGNGNIRLVGKGYFPPCDMPDLTFPDTMIAARISGDCVASGFLQVLWNGSSVRRQIESLARTTNGTFKVNQTMLESIRLIAPPLPLQREFAAQVSAVERLKASQRASLAKLDALFACLQHRAFRGEL